MHVWILLPSLASAVEGMWEPAQLPSLAPSLAAAGYDGDATALARLDAAPLGAVVSLGGCTASFVSPDGLLVTNQHCVTGYLQQATREGEDLVDAGFLAATRADERSVGPGGRVFLTVDVRDVTANVLGRFPASISDVDRALTIEAREKALVAACEKPAGTRCRVAAFYGGGVRRLVVQRELRDLRIVAAPPDSVGNYGDEVDNWHWPRHAGDFAFLRAYTAPDGSSADYSPTNVPYRPPQHLRVAARGPSPGEFVMVAGYPGSTERWLTATEVEREASRLLPRTLEDLTFIFDVLTDEQRLDPARAKAIEVPRLGVGNGLFNTKGTLEGFARSQVAAVARSRDARLVQWVKSDPSRATRFLPAIEELERVIASRDATWERDRALGWLGRSSDLLGAAETVVRWAAEQERPDAKRQPGFQERDRARTLARLDQLQPRLHLSADRRLFRHYLLAAIAPPDSPRVPELAAWFRGNGAAPSEAAVDAALDVMYATTSLTTIDGRRAAFGSNLKALRASPDPFVRLAVALLPVRDEQHVAGLAQAGALARTRPGWVEAMRAMNPAVSYPDANGTLRVTYGTVMGYSPRDGVLYTPQTTLEGLAAKAGPWPFDAPAPLLAAVAARAYGPEGDPALGGAVPVDFLSDLDITGGNSGSPTLNAKGELVGLAFDGTWEGIASDWMFDPEVSRTVHVDIRYVRWYLREVAHADALLAELGAGT